MIVLSQSDTAFPLTPALSRWERGDIIPLLGKFWSHRFGYTLRTILPRPLGGGEGRGEGARFEFRTRLRIVAAEVRWRIGGS